jgi:hypothetical protein
MAPSAAEPSDVDSPRNPPTAEELSEALKIDVYDREGKTKSLGELIKGQRTVLVFIRHFCKCYLMRLVATLGPTSCVKTIGHYNPPERLEGQDTRE